MITDDMLKAATDELEAAMIAAMPDPKECYHEFSMRFERKMKKVIYRANHPFVAQLGQRAAAVILAILLLGGSILLISPDARAAFVGWIKEVYENCYHYFVPATASEDMREGIPTSYHLGWLPEGYVLLDSFEIDNGTSMIYVDAKGNILQFRYFFNPGTLEGSLLLETDGYKHQEVLITDLTADLFVDTSVNENNGLVWMNKNGTILFYLSAQLDADMLLRIAESVVPDKK